MAKKHQGKTAVIEGLKAKSEAKPTVPVRVPPTAARPAPRPATPMPHRPALTVLPQQKGGPAPRASTVDAGLPTVVIENYPGTEHRQFPRAKLEVPFAVWIGEGDDRRFGATLLSRNISVSGAFLFSTFFLPIGTEVRLKFQLDPKGDPVEARAEVIREERPNGKGEGRSGMAVRFLEFYSQSEVTLARLFMGERLRAFAQRYLQSARAAAMPSELDRVVDALAAWELAKVTGEGDPWKVA